MPLFLTLPGMPVPAVLTWQTATDLLRLCSSVTSIVPSLMTLVYERSHMLPCVPTEVCNFLYWSTYCLVLELFVNPSLSSSKPVFLNLGSTLEAPREF